MSWYDYTYSKLKDANIECYKLRDRNIFLKKRKRACLVNHYKYKVNINREKYYYSLLLLFKPWRNFEDLKNGYATYAESFESLENTLPEAIKKYQDKLTEIEKAFEIAKDLVQDKIKECEEENQENDEASLECHPIEVDQAMKDFKDIDDNILEFNLEKIVKNLNQDQ